MIYFIYLKGFTTERRERERKDSSISWFTPQMTVMTGGPGQRQGLGGSYISVLWLQGHPLPLPQALSRHLDVCGAARAQRGIHMVCWCWKQQLDPLHHNIFYFCNFFVVKPILFYNETSMNKITSIYFPKINGIGLIQET